jgi:protein-S-isoprenylcysteine O-methyltransferase
MRILQISLLVLGSVWVASEVSLAVFRRSSGGGTHKDAGTLKLLNLVIYGALPLAFLLGRRGYGHLAVPLQFLWAGFALIFTGLALKWWAVFSLRQFFTVDVVIQPNHHIVRRGPYRHLRHPAYSGVLLSFFGLALCTSSWISALVIFVPITAVFLYRIHVEEQALNEALPNEYRQYSAETSRLIPGVY